LRPIERLAQPAPAVVSVSGFRDRAGGAARLRGALRPPGIAVPFGCRAGNLPDRPWPGGRIELEAGGAGFELAGGERFAAQLAERRYVNRFMVALPVQGPVRRTVLVTRDMLGEESFRLLRIWALWGKLPQVAAKQLPA
jgi:hypothetical protein